MHYCRHGCFMVVVVITMVTRVAIVVWLWLISGCGCGCFLIVAILVTASGGSLVGQMFSALDRSRLHCSDPEVDICGNTLDGSCVCVCEQVG